MGVLYSPIAVRTVSAVIHHLLYLCFSEGGFRHQPHRRSRTLLTPTTTATSATSHTASSSSISIASVAAATASKAKSKTTLSSQKLTSPKAPAVPPKTYLDDTASDNASVGAMTNDQSYELPNYNQQNVVSDFLVFVVKGARNALSSGKKRAPATRSRFSCKCSYLFSVTYSASNLFVESWNPPRDGTVYFLCELRVHVYNFGEGVEYFCYD